MRGVCAFCGEGMTTRKGAVIRGLPDFPVCDTCESFTQDCMLDLNAVALAKKKQPKRFDQLTGYLAEWKNAKGGAAADFIAGSVYEEVVQSSMLDESHKFMSRERFKAVHGLWPDEVKLTQVRCLNRKNEEVVGVVVSTGQDATLTLRTERRLIQMLPVLPTTHHIFKDQASMVFEAKVEERAQVLGQKTGNKYKAIFFTHFPGG